MRIYDPRLGRFLSVDPITADYPELTPFQFASNNPIQNIDLDGLEGKAFQAQAKAKKYGVNSLKVQTVEAGFGDVQTQLYSLKAHGTSQEFAKFKETMLTDPGKITNNTYAKYWPIKAKGEETKKLKEGDEIEILPKIGVVPIAPVHVFVRIMQVDETNTSFEMTFATLEGHPEAGYVKFSGTFDEKTKTINANILTETREVWGISKIGPSRTLQVSQWETVINNMRTSLGKEKKDVTARESIQVYKYKETEPMGKGEKKSDTTKNIE